MNKLWYVLIVVVLLVVGYFAYRAYYPGGSKTTTSSSNSQPNTVTIANFAFSPSDLTVPAGTEVTFTNNDSTAHTVTFDSFASDRLSPGSSFKHTFATPGTFNYHCSIHTYMTGRIIVQ